MFIVHVDGSTLLTKLSKIAKINEGKIVMWSLHVKCKSRFVNLRQFVSLAKFKFYWSAETKQKTRIKSMIGLYMKMNFGFYMAWSGLIDKLLLVVRMNTDKHAKCLYYGNNNLTWTYSIVEFYQISSSRIWEHHHISIYI